MLTNKTPVLIAYIFVYIQLYFLQFLPDYPVTLDSHLVLPVCHYTPLPICNYYMCKTKAPFFWSRLIVGIFLRVKLLAKDHLDKRCSRVRFSWWPFFQMFKKRSNSGDRQATL